MKNNPEPMKDSPGCIPIEYGLDVSSDADTMTTLRRWFFRRSDGNHRFDGRAVFGSIAGPANERKQE